MICLGKWTGRRLDAPSGLEMGVVLAALPMAVGQWGGDRNISSVLLRLLLDGGHRVSVRTTDGLYGHRTTVGVYG